MEKKQINSVVKEIVTSVQEVTENKNNDISGVFDNFTKHDKNVREEFKKNLENIITSNLSQRDDSTGKIIKEVKDFITPRNYNKLTDIIKNSDLSFFEDYNKQLKIKTIKRSGRRISRNNEEKIKKGAEYTILTNGTTDIWNIKKDSLQRKLADNYYLTKDEGLSSKLALDEYSSILESKNSEFINWIGDNISDSVKKQKKTMEAKANEIATWILGKNPSSINLIGHSHGGNIMVLVTNLLYNNEFDVKNKIFNLITLSTPVRSDVQLERKIENKINHTEFFSKKDFVQNTGFIDNPDYPSVLILSLLTSFFGLIPVLCGAFGRHNFKYAKHRVDITHYIENVSKEDCDNVDYIFNKINNNLKSIRGNLKSSFKYHQATRSVKLFENLLNKNELL